MPLLCIREVPGSVPGRDSEVILFATASRTALGPTHFPILWVPAAPSAVVMGPGRQADHSPPSSAKVKNAWSYTSISQYVFIAWCLNKYRMSSWSGT